MRNNICYIIVLMNQKHIIFVYVVRIDIMSENYVSLHYYYKFYIIFHKVELNCLLKLKWFFFSNRKHDLSAQQLNASRYSYILGYTNNRFFFLILSERSFLYLNLVFLFKSTSHQWRLNTYIFKICCSYGTPIINLL